MKKLILLLLIPLSILSQEEDVEAKRLVESFITAYNAEDYQSVFELFSTGMKTALPVSYTHLRAHETDS